MILLHCFLRTIKKKTYLMADSSTSKGCTPLWETPEILFEVDNIEEDRAIWVERVTKRLAGSHPNLELVKVFKPRKRKGSLQAFDMTYKQKES